jgi:hypothetical protein
VSFQAYLDNIKAKPGKTPDDFRTLAKRAGILAPDVKALPACPAYVDASEKIVSRKPLGSLTSNARLFHSVS